MLWLVPHLFPDPRLLEIAGRGLHVPGLRTLLARGTHVTEPCEGTEEALCRALGIARQQEARKMRGAVLFQAYKKKMGMVQPAAAAPTQAAPEKQERQKIAEK